MTLNSSRQWRTNNPARMGKETKSDSVSLDGHGEIVIQRTLISMGDDLYRSCAFAWGETMWSFFSSQENDTSLKQAPFCSF